MNTLVLVMVIATIVDYLSTIILTHLMNLEKTAEENEIVTLLVHTALGLIAAFAFGLNVFASLGLPIGVPVVALVLSGLVYAGGATGVSQLLAAIKAIGAPTSAGGTLSKAG